MYGLFVTKQRAGYWIGQLMSSVLKLQSKNIHHLWNCISIFKVVFTWSLFLVIFSTIKCLYQVEVILTCY